MRGAGVSVNRHRQPSLTWRARRESSTSGSDPPEICPDTWFRMHPSFSAHPSAVGVLVGRLPWHSVVGLEFRRTHVASYVCVRMDGWALRPRRPPVTVLDRATALRSSPDRKRLHRLRDADGPLVGLVQRGCQ